MTMYRAYDKAYLDKGEPAPWSLDDDRWTYCCEDVDKLVAQCLGEPVVHDYFIMRESKEHLDYVREI